MTGGERRAAIVECAIRLFAEKGFRGTTTRQLAAALGVTEPVLYQHFATKSELYSAIIEAKAAEGQNRVEELAALAKGSDDRAFFTHLAGLILDRYEQDPQFIRLLFQSALEGHELAARFYRSRVVAFNDLVAGYIRRRMAEGAFRQVHPGVAARAFIGMVNDHGMGEMIFQAPAVASRKKVVEELVSVFLHGIAAPR